MMTHSGHVVTLANSIIGVGILAMPFCFQKCGILLAILLILVSNWITRICCHYLIKSSLLTRRKSFEFLGFHAFGSSGKLLVELCIIGYLVGTCITYFVVVGDLGPQIITKMFTHNNGHPHLRIYFMFAVTLLCILPLGMLKNVDSLSTVFTASIGFYVCLILKIVLESKVHILANDWTDKVDFWRPAGILQCLPIFSMALSCQMQLFEVFKSVNNQSVEKLNGIVRDATWICTLVYIAVGFFGYVAFCTQTFSGNILMNFSPSFSSDIIKIGFILSVAFSFPLVIFPCRASIYSLLYRKGHMDGTGGYIPESRFKIITVFIVAFALFVALMIPSVELIIGLVGSTIGVAICIMFPAACFKKITKKQSTESTYAFSNLILFGGFCLMVLGTYANLQAIDEQRSGAHLETVQITNTDISLLKDEMLQLLNKNVESPEGNVVVEKNINLSAAEDQIKKSLNRSISSEKHVIVDKKIVPIEIASKLPASQAPALTADKLNVMEKNSKIQMPKEANIKNNIDPANIVIAGEINLLKAKNSSANLNQAKAKEEIIQHLPQVFPSVSPIIVNSGVSENINKMQQNIDKDAIKKDEEIAAEEQKSNKEQKIKATEDELKKTQNELKKTKELLERKVDEIKEELAKKNKETQDLMVEKLEEVVEKVEQIEREVQKKDDSIKTPESKPVVVPQEIADKDIEKIPILLNKLTEASAPKPSKVYEPLSYKTGELIEQVRNGSQLEQRLPMPLAVLINSSRIKPGNAKPSQETLVDSIQVKLPELTSELKEENLKHLETAEKSNLVANGTNFEQPKLAKSNQNDKDANVEAIRRDILQFSEDKIKDADSTLRALKNSHERIKRELNLAIGYNTVEGQYAKQDCLPEPKMEELLQPGSGGAHGLEIKSIRRELKSVQEKDTEKSENIYET